MKKLLVLALVLSMATMASAALKISVNGVQDGTVTLQPSQTAVLSISTDAIIGFGIGDWAGLELVANISEATISGGAVAEPYATNEPGMSVWNPAGVGGLEMPTPQGQEGVGMTLAITGSNIPALSLLFQNILFHCESGPSVTVVTLYGSQDFITLTELGHVTITQTPEPITMALLGLGGLFLRRRSK